MQDHFAKITKKYTDMLTSNNDRFVPVTYEDFLTTCNRHKPNDKIGKWLDYLQERYIVEA